MLCFFLSILDDGHVLYSFFNRSLKILDSVYHTGLRILVAVLIIGACMRLLVGLLNSTIGLVFFIRPNHVSIPMFPPKIPNKSCNL